LIRWAALAFTIAVGGCVAPPDEAPVTFEDEPVSLPSERGQAIVRISLAGHAIVRGENDFEVELISTSPGVAGEIVAASGFMPAHGHGTVPPTIDASNGAFLVQDLVLYMPGRWEITFELRVQGLEDGVTFPVDVP
jgi:hypothetical protein